MRKFLSSLLLALPMIAIAQSASIEQCQQWAQENYPLTQRYDIIRQTEGFTLNNIAKGWLPQIGVSAQGSYQSAVPEYPEVLSNMREYQGKVTWIAHKAEFTPKTIQTKDERANLVYAIKVSVKNGEYFI